MTVNSGEYKSRVGLDSLYIAEVTADTASGYTAGTPYYFAPAAEATLEPSTESATQYADDQAYEVMTSEGETKIKLKITNIPLSVLADITGRVYDTGSGRFFDNPDAVPPYFALLFRSKTSSGDYRYYSYLKGRFEMPAEEIRTLGEKPDPKTTEIVYTAIRTIYEFDLGDIDGSVKRVVGDTAADAFDETNWFAQVQTPASVSPSALALSSSDPSDGDSGVAVGKTVTLTFNNELQAAAIYGVVLVKADGTVKACTNSLDATKKIMTVNPDTDMDAGSTYIVSIAVTDIYGDTLQSAINFGTA